MLFLEIIRELNEDHAEADKNLLIIFSVVYHQHSY